MTAAFQDLGVIVLCLVAVGFLFWVYDYFKAKRIESENARRFKALMAQEDREIRESLHDSGRWPYRSGEKR